MWGGGAVQGVIFTSCCLESFIHKTTSKYYANVIRYIIQWNFMCVYVWFQNIIYVPLLHPRRLFPALYIYINPFTRRGLSACKNLVLHFL